MVEEGEQRSLVVITKQIIKYSHYQKDLQPEKDDCKAQRRSFIALLSWWHGGGEGAAGSGNKN